MLSAAVVRVIDVRVVAVAAVCRLITERVLKGFASELLVSIVVLCSG